MLEKPAPAPASVVLKELLKGKKASQEQLLRVLEERREILARGMKSFSQKTLGQLKCLGSGDGSQHELRIDSPLVTSLDKEFSLGTRGFFAGNLFCKRKETGKEKECITFGTNGESWLLIKIKFTTGNYMMGTGEWNNAIEGAYHVEITRTDLPTILKEVELKPKEIWTYFMLITDEWVSNRKNLYDEAYAIAKGMKEESYLFNMIS